jgi:hypothetical protein
MNACGYCGQENDPKATVCRGCGTSLAAERPWSFKTSVMWSPRSDEGLIACAIVASLLICSALYGISTNVAGQIMVVHYRSQWGGRSDDYTDFFPVLPHWFVWLARVVVFGLPLGLCRLRCRKVSHALLAASITISIMIVVCTKVPALQLFLPMYLISFLAPHSWIGLYVGAMLQLVFGAWFLGMVGWLLGWFGQQKTQDHSTGEPAG